MTRFAICRGMKKLLARDALYQARLKDFSKHPSCFSCYARVKGKDKCDSSEIERYSFPDHKRYARRLLSTSVEISRNHSGGPATINFVGNADCLAYSPIREVFKSICKLKPKLTVGSQGCTEILIPVLTFLFNISLETGVFQPRWKLALVFPIIKSGTSCDISYFCPVSHCGFSELLEMVIYYKIFALS